MSVEVCGCVGGVLRHLRCVCVCGGCFEAFEVCVCRGGGWGFPLDRNQADFAVVWSYGIILHLNIKSVEVCGREWVCFWHFLEFVRVRGCVWVCGWVLV